MSTAPRPAPARAYINRPRSPRSLTPLPLSPRSLLAKPHPASVASLPARLEQSAPGAPSCPEQGGGFPSLSLHVSHFPLAAPHHPDPPLPFLAMPRYQEGSCRSTEADDVPEPRRPSGGSPRPVAAPGEADEPPQPPRHRRSPPQALGEPSPSRPALPLRCPSSPLSRRRRRRQSRLILIGRQLTVSFRHRVTDRQAPPVSPFKNRFPPRGHGIGPAR